MCLKRGRRKHPTKMIKKRLESMITRSDKVVVKLDRDLPDAVYFKADEDLVIISKTESYMYFKMCTCRHCSTHFATAELKGRMPLCKRKIAVIRQLPLK